MKDRIRQLMEDQHLTQQNFAQMIGISTATLSNIFNGKTNPSLSIVDGIHKSFPQVNVYWVLYGTPPMYQNQASQGGSEEGAADMHQGITDGAAGGAEGMKQGSQPSGAASAEPTLFDQPQMHGVNRTPKNIAQAAVKFVDKPQRKITEIRIFYDDQTWETFVPKK